MDKQPQRLAKNKTDLMPKNASCKRWDTLTSTAARRSTRKGSQRNQALLWGSGIPPCWDGADGRMGLPHG
jgi:hypothetical protein